MRLDQFISKATGFSRSQCHKLIRQGRVEVQGLSSAKANFKLSNQAVFLNGEALSLPEALYLMLHKPAGYVCALSDAQHPTVLDLLELEIACRENLQIVGRLDLDTTGLLLLTTDGQWNHRITSPNSSCHKTYRVTLASPISDDDIRRLKQGVLLKSDTKATRPCIIHRVNELEITMQLAEGKYHQVKRMLAAVGNCVLNLHRERIAHLPLDEKLCSGEYRALTPSEIEAF